MNFKYLSNATFLLALVAFSFQLSAQQWAPSFANIGAIIYRTGNVGLGTTTPEANLHIAVDGGDLFNEGGDGEAPGGDVVIGGGGSPGAGNDFQIRLDKNYDQASYLWGIDAGNNLNFSRDNGSGFENMMNINGAGVRVFGDQVSIGSSTDQVNLGSGSAGQFLAMGYRPITATTYQEAGSGGAVIYADGGGGLGLANKASGALNVTEDTRVLINAAGQMGVGTLAPSQKLHLVDNGPVAVRLDIGDINWDLQADADQKFRLRRSGESLFSVNRNGQMAIGTENTPETLDGTDTDISAYRLFVEGGILTKEIRVRNPWADYVFESDYELLPLAEVESYIDEHGHLPNTPSAEEIERRGLNLGAATSLQQEKIEELYLHVIELSKRLEALEQENMQLKAKKNK